MKYYEIKKFLAIIILIIFHFAFVSCSSPKHCTKSKTNNDILSLTNTNWNELAPFFFDNSFYFIRQKNSKNAKSIIYKYNIIQNRVIESELFKINNFNNPSNFSFYQASDTTAVYFAATIIKNKIPNRDIFQAKILNGEIIDILPVSDINTDYFEAYPTISQDGQLLVFVSDREGGYGGTDLYYSIKNSQGNWSESKNMGDKINTPANEISPFIDKNNNLYFCSNGFDNRTDFNIIKAQYEGNNQWELAKLLPSPINSDSNDINPYITNNQIYYSSNRDGGCGGYDIYSDKLCGEVFLSGQVLDKQNNLPLAGILKIYNDSSKLISEIQIKNDGKFIEKLDPNSQYSLEYYNSCVPLYTPRKSIHTPCNVESVTQFNLSIELKLDGNEYEFTGVDIPFFVSGYYKPNLPNELQNLRMLFENNILGLDDSTKYIEYPNEKYDGYSEIVKNALKSLANTIIEILKDSKTNCDIELYKKIKIQITGYADERGFSDLAKYAGEDINDPIMNKTIVRGM
ncbi:MAG: PD40 domain-containing protein, partial [Candidatus Kapabacteria bacterium]|nr:PD40 domain-containing protein [Candidatus Kapabacteria bacterium]